MSANEISFIKSGPTTWVARNGNYVIVQHGVGGGKTFELKDGFGRLIKHCATKRVAVTSATAHQNGETL